MKNFPPDGFASKVDAVFCSALPLDVRLWLRPAVVSATNHGLCPSSGLWPEEYEGKARTDGEAANQQRLLRRGKAAASH